MEGVPKALLDTQPVSAPCPSFSICPFLRFPTWKTDGAILDQRIESAKRRTTRGKGAKGTIRAGRVANAFWSCAAHSLWVRKRRPGAWASDITELRYRSGRFTPTRMWNRKGPKTSLLFKPLNQQYFSFLSLAAKSHLKSSHKESPTGRWKLKPQTWSQSPRARVQSGRSGGWWQRREGGHLRGPSHSSLCPFRKVPLLLVLLFPASGVRVSLLCSSRCEATAIPSQTSQSNHKDWRIEYGVSKASAMMLTALLRCNSRLIKFSPSAWIQCFSLFSRGYSSITI